MSSIDLNERSAPKLELLYMTTELLHRSRIYFGSQGGKELHFLSISIVRFVAPPFASR